MKTNIKKVITSIPKDAPLINVLNYYIALILQIIKNEEKHRVLIINLLEFYKIASIASRKNDYDLEKCLKSEVMVDENDGCFMIELMKTYENEKDNDMTMLSFIAEFTKKYGKNEKTYAAIFTLLFNILYNIERNGFSKLFFK